VSAFSGGGGSDSGGWVFPTGAGWSPAGIGLLVIFTIVAMAIGGYEVQEIVGALLTTTPDELQAWMEQSETVQGFREPEPPPVSWLPGNTPPVTVSSPVEPWTQPDVTAPRTRFVLQPGQRYTPVGRTGSGPGDWVLVRSGDQEGWVHQSTLEPWQQVTTVDVPFATHAWEWVRFQSQFRTTLPNGGAYELPPGDYRLGAADANGYRQVFDTDGKPLGSVHTSKIPATPNQPTPTPPPPAPPPS
jgi:hypothetical protein